MWARYPQTCVKMVAAPLPPDVGDARNCSLQRPYESEPSLPSSIAVPSGPAADSRTNRTPLLSYPIQRDELRKASVSTLYEVKRPNDVRFAHSAAVK